MFDLEANFHLVLNTIAIIFEIIGGVVISLSAIAALLQWGKKFLPAFKSERENIRDLRLVFGDQIVFALEFFIAGDIIQSILAPTFAELTKLAIIVAIRTVLHYSLIR